MSDPIDVLRATAPHPESPLPWQLDEHGAVYAANGECVGDFMLPGDAAHIVDCVNAAPEVDRLRAQLAAAREAVKELPYMVHSEYCTGWEDHGDFAGCDCSAGSFNDTIESARRALGLEDK